MNCIAIIAAVVLLPGLAACAASLPAPDRVTNSATQPGAHAAPASSGLTLESFQVIPERNIFNPNRSGRNPEREYRREERKVRTESFALVGTLGYEKGYFAFFDGSSSDYRRVLKASDSIAGFTVAAVSPQQVSLQSSNHGDYALPMGMQLQRMDEGKWELAPRTQSSSGSLTSTGSRAGFVSSNGGGSEEVLKRLMQQREQEGAINPPPVSETPPTPSRPMTTSGSSAEDEIVRRMMQRREQETNK
jgi:hypothetical protein